VTLVPPFENLVPAVLQEIQHQALAHLLRQLPQQYPARQTICTRPSTALWVGFRQVTAIIALLNVAVIAVSQMNPVRQCKPFHFSIVTNILFSLMMWTADENGSTAGEWNCDPNEPRYCLCNQVSYGDMVACDNEEVCGLSAFCLQIYFNFDLSVPVAVSIRMVPLRMRWNLTTSEGQMVLPVVHDFNEKKNKEGKTVKFGRSANLSNAFPVA
jgi:hypothetical protein